MPIAAKTSSATVELVHTTRTFPPEVRAIEDISMSVSPGEFVAILGPSGCGKSTLLRIVAGLDRATGGTVQTSHAGRIAYVFQDAHLLPWRNVLRNVELPLELAGVERSERRARAIESIAQVGLADAARRYPAQLSGGMRMRASLARALVTDPQLLLLDEPFAALDEITRAQLDEQLHALWRSRGMTVLFVTHSITEAAFLANRAVVLTKRPARVVSDRAIDLPKERVQQLRGEPEFARATRMLLEDLMRGGA